jgi:hypothetical protein
VVVELSKWHKKSVNLLNTQGIALKIFEDNGVYSFPVKMLVKIMENYAAECNFPEDHQFSRQELHEQHFTACIRNLDACPRIYNTYRSVIFLFHYIMKAAESVPNLYIQMQMLTINDTAGAVKLIRSYYRKWQGPEIYAKVLEYNTIQIFKGLTMMDFLEVVLLAKKIDQQLLKYLTVRAAQAMHNKYWK